MNLEKILVRHHARHRTDHPRRNTSRPRLELTAFFISGTAATGALRRTGMELTRALAAEIEDFLEGFNKSTCRGMRVDGVRVPVWSSQRGWSGM
jgi:hypothetical protein